MSDVSESNELSRRALREAETGSIPVFDGPPLTRRERKMREEMIATGVIPVQASATGQVGPEAVSVQAPAPVAPAEVATPPVTVEDSVASGPVVAEPEPVVEQVVPEQPAQPLTRRELREQLRGRTPKKRPEASVPAAAPAPPAPEPVMDFAVPVGSVEEAKTWPVLDAPVVDDVAIDSGEVTLVDHPATLPTSADAPSDDEQKEVIEPPLLPLPPVFAPITSRDTETAPALEVGPAAPATNALILPVAPSIDVTGPLGDTGEIIVTGNIPLPRLIAETGLTGVVDADIDDDDYSDYVDPDSGTYTQPVRALDAVSSRSLEIDQPLIQKPRWGSLAITLGVSASILGVTAISLLALALFTNVFGL